MRRFTKAAALNWSAAARIRLSLSPLLGSVSAAVLLGEVGQRYLLEDLGSVGTAPGQGSGQRPEHWLKALIPLCPEPFRDTELCLGG